MVKLYADEEGHELVRGLGEPTIVSALARVEVPAALWRKHRVGTLELDDALLLLRAFRVDYAGTADRAPRFSAMAVTDGMLKRGAELTGNHGLRAYDAVQLASALAARELGGGCETLVAFDRDLIRAAVSEGLRTLFQ